MKIQFFLSSIFFILFSHFIYGQTDTNPSNEANSISPIDAALFQSIAEKNLENTQKALNEGANPNFIAWEGVPLIHLVIKDNYNEALKLFIESGADVNQLCSPNSAMKGAPPLVFAIFADNIEAMKMLISAGAEIDEPFLDDGSTPLAYSIASKKSPEIISLLLEKGANPSFTYKEGQSLLMHSVQLDKPEYASLLIESGADVNYQQPKYLNTALKMAAVGGNNEFVELLLEKGADPKMEDWMGVDAEGAASLEGHFETAKILEKAKEK